MRYFSSSFKNKFDALLCPHGYCSWKNVFYKLDDELCFLIKKEGSYPDVEMTVDFAPYCEDLQSANSMPHEYDPIDGGIPMDVFFGVLTDDETTKDEFYRNYFDVIADGDKQSIARGLDIVCEKIECEMLPYMHKYTDLEFFYSELIILSELRGGRFSYSDKTIFALSLKLRKYDNAIALLDVEGRLPLLDKCINDTGLALSKLLSGNIDSLTLSLQKRRLNAIELKVSAAKNAISNWKRERSELLEMREALLTKDSDYLEDYIIRTENSSREYLDQIFSGNRQDYNLD